MEHKLALKFTTEEEGKYFSMTIDKIKTDEKGDPAITEKDVSDLMDLIVQKKIFLTKNGALVGKKEAKILTSGSQKLDIK